MSVWNFVSSIQATLDDAAGVDTRNDRDDGFGLDDEEDAVVEEDAPQLLSSKGSHHGSGWGDGDSLDLSYNSEESNDRKEDQQDVQQDVPAVGGGHQEEEISSSSGAPAVEVPPGTPDRPFSLEESNAASAGNASPAKPLHETSALFASPTSPEHPSSPITGYQSAGVETPPPVMADLSVDALARSFDGEEVAALRRCNAELDAEVKRLKTRISKMAEKMQTVQTKLNARVEEVLEEGKDLARTLEKEQQTVRVLLDERGAREAKIVSLSNQTEKLEGKLAAVAEERDHLSSKVKALTTEVEHLKGQHKVELEELRKALIHQFEANSEQTSAANMVIVKSAEEEIQSLQEELRLACSRMDDSEQYFAEKEASIRGEVERKLMAAEREVSDANQRALAAEAKSLEAARSGVEEGRTLVAELDQIQQLNDRLQVQLQAKQEQLRRRDAEVEALHLDINNLRTSLEVTKHQLSEVTAQKELQGADFATRRENEANSLKSQISQLMAQDKQRQETIRQLESSLAKAVSERESVELVSATAAAKTPVRAAPSGDTVKPAQQGSSTSTRIEMELAQTAAKLAEASKELSSITSAYNNLISEHDVLLQLYGEKEEEVDELAAKLTAFTTSP